MSQAFAHPVFRQTASVDPLSRYCARLLLTLLLGAMLAMHPAEAQNGRFEGLHYRGSGDVEYLELLDTARRMFTPDPQLQNLSMLYIPTWNGFTEGPTWKAWWIQNSYGTSYCALPFLEEPYVTMLQNANDLWFTQMGDGKRVGDSGYVAPDGCLCDAAGPGFIYYRQGDGRPEIHDWAMEFTAAGLLVQAESLLISRAPDAVAAYLPELERCAAFLETRRDPKNNLMLAGPGANLLAPSYAGYRKPDGSYGMAYLTGLSVTTCAALDRLIEVEKLAHRPEQAEVYMKRRAALTKGLAQLTTPEGYLIRSLDPDGQRHGVYGAQRHGYFETPPNQDAIAFHVVNDAQAKRIFDRIVSIPELRPHRFILPNYPSYDDMYEEPAGIWAYGTWVNGGHWSTCEARMMLAYYRMGDYESARRSMQTLLDFARRFRLDNPLSNRGADVYQPAEPINITYDAFAPAAAMMRGLFEYLYRADRLILLPHVPAGITEMEQLDPVRFGARRIYLSTFGHGAVSGVLINGKPWRRHDAVSVTLPYDEMPDVTVVQILLGNAAPGSFGAARVDDASWLREPPADVPTDLKDLLPRAALLRRFYARLTQADLFDTYEAAHTRLALQCIATVFTRRKMKASGAIAPLPGPSSQAADQSYYETATRLYDGLAALLAADRTAADPRRRRIYDCWAADGP